MKLDIYWLNSQLPGRLAIVARPRGGDWLEQEVKAWKDAGINTIVSALESGEVSEFDLSQEEERCRIDGLEFVSFPIPDRGVPASLERAANLAHDLRDELVDGRSVGIHCRQGIGRSGLLASCILLQQNDNVSEVLESISQARSRPVPETPEQREWIARFARHLKKAHAN